MPVLELRTARGTQRLAAGLACEELPLHPLHDIVVRLGGHQTVVGQIAHVYEEVPVQVLGEQLMAALIEEHFAGQRYLNVAHVAADVRHRRAYVSFNS